MDGVLVVDKPQGLTSHDVVAVARRCLHERRIGHTGTLDPLATGVLPLACGRATRLVRFFVSSDKDYEASDPVRRDDRFLRHHRSRDRRSGRVPTRDGGRGRARVAAWRLPAGAAGLLGEEGRRASERTRGRGGTKPVALAPVPVRVTRAELLEFTGTSARVGADVLGGLLRAHALRMTLGELVGTGACLEVAAPHAKRRVRRSTRRVDLEHVQPVERGRDASAGFRSTASCRVCPWSALSERRAQAGVPWADGGCGARWPEDSDCLRSGPAHWIRLLDEEGRLVALGTVDSTRGILCTRPSS